MRAEAEGKWREASRRRTTRHAPPRRAEPGAEGAHDVSQNLYGATRTGLLNRLEAVGKDLVTAQQSVTDLEEEGRRSRYRR